MLFFYISLETNMLNELFKVLFPLKMESIFIALFESTGHTKCFLQHESAFIHSYTNGKLLYKEPPCTGTHTHIHKPMQQPSEVIWGSCSRTLRHVDHRSQGLNHQPSDW